MKKSSHFPPENVLAGKCPSVGVTGVVVLEYVEDEMTPEISIGEERIEKFMQELYKEMTTAAAAGTDEPPPSSFFRNGRESESCGVAVSDSTSTVMAGVEFDGKMMSPPATENGGRCGCKCSSNGRLVVVGSVEAEGGAVKDGSGGCGTHVNVEVDGYDEEEWFSRVLSWGPADLVPGFWNDVQCVGLLSRERESSETPDLVR